MDDSPLPIVLMIVVIPLVVTIVLGFISSRQTTPPLAFHCRRCDRRFQQPAHHRFPRSCPHCHARDWSAGA